jgi:hypothetical protein
MRLDNIHNQDIMTPDRMILEQYVKRLKGLLYSPSGVLTEGKRVVVTTEILDDDDPKTQVAKEEFIEKAKKIGDFDNPEWLERMVNGLKQAGVQGLNEVKEGEQPATTKDFKELIGLLVEYIRNAK